MAVNIQHVVRPIPKSPVISGPYDLIDLQINGKPIQGRPVAWDSEIHDYHNQLNVHGGPVIPIRVITMCPDCCGGFELDIPPREVDCPLCRPPVEAPVVVMPTDPFINPFESGVVNFEEVNLDLISVLNELPNDTVADRF